MDHEIDRQHSDAAEAGLESLARYVAGECSAGEVSEIERRIEAEPRLRAVLAEMRTIWDHARVAPAGWDAEAAWRGLLQRFETSSAADRRRVAPREHARPTISGPTPTASRRHRPFMPPAFRIAAVLAAAAVGGVLYYQRFVEPATPPAREYATGVGERGQLQLEDGTRITLGVASQLRIAAEYGKRERRITLEGTALFDVPHDPERRFVVRTAQGEVEDVGTRFDVRSYPGDTITQVVVAEGRVALRAGNEAGARAAELGPGQLGRATAAGDVTVHSEVDVARYLAWTDGRLVFEGTPLAEALPELSRWYHLEFRLADTSLAQLPITATFRDQPTADVLDLLALSLDLRLERRGDTIIFHARNR